MEHQGNNQTEPDFSLERIPEEARVRFKRGEVVWNSMVWWMWEGYCFAVQAPVIKGQYASQVYLMFAPTAEEVREAEEA